MLDAVVPAGSEIIALAPPAPSGSVVAEPGALAIVYEDQSLLAVNKPPGMLVHPARGRGSGTLANLVAAHLQTQGLSAVVRPTGRLDRGTSGLVIFAKTRHAHYSLSEQGHKGLRRRTYLALCGPAAVSRGDVLHIDAAIVSPPTDSHRYRSPRAAQTEARVLARYPAGVIVQVELATGRTHQIRQHLAGAGWWLWGDWLYGGRDGPIDRPALHAWRAEFAHPVHGTRVALHAPLPPDMRALLRWFRQGGQKL
jgi:23S rRNA pseudouridine1911/1915/1917 synthase